MLELRDLTKQTLPFVAAFSSSLNDVIFLLGHILEFILFGVSAYFAT